MDASVRRSASARCGALAWWLATRGLLAAALLAVMVVSWRGPAGLEVALHNGTTRPLSDVWVACRSDRAPLQTIPPGVERRTVLRPRADTSLWVAFTFDGQSWRRDFSTYLTAGDVGVASARIELSGGVAGARVPVLADVVVDSHLATLGAVEPFGPFGRGVGFGVCALALLVLGWRELGRGRARQG